MYLRNPRCWSGKALVVAIAVGATAVELKAQWPQWGGPNRDFTVETSGLADSWPDGGPRQLWKRTLGDGYSGIVYDDGVLYTMCRKKRTAAREYTVALDAQTGKTLWEHANPAPLESQDDSGWGGLGPNASPLVVGDRLYSVGSRGALHCFEKGAGRVLWENDLAREFGAPISKTTGYSPSPLAYENTVIVWVGSAGGEGKAGRALVALDQGTGDIAWAAQDFGLGFSSPILIRFEGQDQLVLSDGARGLIGLDPANGQRLWQHPKPGSIVTPVWNGTDTLFYSSGGDRAFGLAVQLTREDDRTVPHELWSNQKVNIWQPTPVRIGGFLYGSTSEMFVGVELTTGKRTWAKRGFPTATCVHGDGKLIILDQDGKLTLATATPEGLTIHAESRITEKYSFTVPTLVGRTLYVRDRKHIMALDLG